VSHVFHRNLKSGLPTAIRGEGVYLYDSSGKQYLDGSCGAAVSCLGHGDPEIIAAIAEQSRKLSFVHSGFFTSDPLERLADKMIEQAPSGMDKVYFTSGGSEAVENAIKIARQYFLEKGEPSRHRIISRRNSYHGNTLGALGVGNNLWRTSPFTKMLVQSAHVSPCYAYRYQQDGESEESFALRMADEVEQAILSEGPENVAAFVAETVVGASLGAVSAAKGYFLKIREICDQYGVLLILDEVMCGTGRTGTFHACEQEGIAPDLMTVAKGLGGGYQPIGAVYIGDKVSNAFEQGSGIYRGGHTYSGHAISCAAALAVLNAIEERNLLENVRSKGKLLEELLRVKFADHPHIGDIRGRGLFQAVEIVADKGTKAPFDANLGIAAKIKGEGMRNGLICYPGTGSANGTAGDHILLAPPFIVEEAHIEELVDKLGDAANSVLDFA